MERGVTGKFQPVAETWDNRDFSTFLIFLKTINIVSVLVFEAILFPLWFKESNSIQFYIGYWYSKQTGWTEIETVKC